MAFQVSALFFCVLCAIGFVYWVYRANKADSTDYSLPFQGRLILLFLGYFSTGLGAAIIQGVRFVAAFLVLTVAGFVVWAIIATTDKKRPRNKEIALPIWVGVPLSSIWELLPESWHCRHH